MPDCAVTPILISYLLIDSGNNILKTVVWPSKESQKLPDFFIDLIHHFTCLAAALYCDFNAHRDCNGNGNPFIEMMLAECTTPFLSLWRCCGSDNTFGLSSGIVFIVLFISVRLIYHCWWVIPRLINQCHYSWTICTAAAVYTALNLWFTWGILVKTKSTFFS